MIEARTVTCPECGFQAMDRGPIDWPAFTGDVTPYAGLCRHLDEAPEPPGDAFYCMSLRTAAKRAAMAAGIARDRFDPRPAPGVRVPQEHSTFDLPPTAEKTGDVIGEP